MPGEINLETLLRRLRPSLHADEFVFCTASHPSGNPIGIFREPEGVTFIVPRAEAVRLGLAFTFPCRMITLTVHSSLEAVGLLARVTAALAARGISVNPVSAYYHDHLFVPADRATEAMDTLRALADTGVQCSNKADADPAPVVRPSAPRRR
jgi:hypothetical protein